MSLDYDLTGFLGAGSQLHWPGTNQQPAAPMVSVRQLTGQPIHSARQRGHALAASHGHAHTGIGHYGHGSGHHPAHPKTHIVHSWSKGEKAF